MYLDNLPEYPIPSRDLDDTDTDKVNVVQNCSKLDFLRDSNIYFDLIQLNEQSGVNHILMKQSKSVDNLFKTQPVSIKVSTKTCGRCVELSSSGKKYEAIMNNLIHS